MLYGKALRVQSFSYQEGTEVLIHALECSGWCDHTNITVRPNNYHRYFCLVDTESCIRASAQTACHIHIVDQDPVWTYVSIVGQCKVR